MAKVHLRSGPAVDEILELAEELEAGLTVMGSRGIVRGEPLRLVVGCSPLISAFPDGSCP